MASKTSSPVYIDNDIITKLEEFLKSKEGEKIALKDPKKVIQYIVTSYIQERS